jgi:uncharacterized membrane protein YbhN (UPF0104 family)
VERRRRTSFPDSNVPPLNALIPQLDKRALLAGGLAFLLLGILVVRPELLGDRVGDAVAGLAAASPGWLWLAGVSFLALIVCTGCAWRAGLVSCGARIGVFDAAARYGTGSLVNTVAPGGAGGPLRVALFSRTLTGSDRILTAAGVAAAIAAARAPVLALLVVVAALTGGFPVWPVALLGGATAVAVLVAFFARRRLPHARLAHLLDVFRALGRSPRTAASVVAWVSAAMTARLAAAACIAAAMGIGAPVRAALIMVPALALACAVPLLPGNLGIGSGAIAVSLHLLGVDAPTAIATGIAYQAVESCVSVLAGSAGLVYLARLPVPAWTLRLAGGTACLALVAGFGATLLVQL